MRRFVGALSLLGFAFFAIAATQSNATVLRVHRDLNLQYTVQFAATLGNFNSALPVSINNQEQMTGTGASCGFLKGRRSGFGPDQCGPPLRTRGQAHNNGIVFGDCLFFDGSNLIDFTPQYSNICDPAWINEFGTIVGAAAGGDDKRRNIGPNIFTQAFIYNAPSQVFSTQPVSNFVQVNNLSVAVGGSLPAVTYNIVTNEYTNMIDPQTGCEMYAPFGINDHNDVFGEDLCGGKDERPNFLGGRFEIVSNGGNTWRYLSVPSGYLVATLPQNIHDDVLLTGISSHHTYLWKNAQGTPIDLGYLPSHNGDIYSPIAFNNAETVVGEDTTFGILWVWDPAHGMRNLSNLIKPNSYFEITPTAINTAGDIASYAFDSYDNLTWLVLLHPHV